MTMKEVLKRYEQRMNSAMAQGMSENEAKRYAERGKRNDMVAELEQRYDDRKAEAVRRLCERNGWTV